jgi:hypothetical protein
VLVAHRVDIALDPMKPADLEPVADLPFAQAQAQQLRVRDHSVLVAGHLGYLPIDRLHWTFGA